MTGTALCLGLDVLNLQAFHSYKVFAMEGPVFEDFLLRL
jgi:hypothetical protein